MLTESQTVGIRELLSRLERDVIYSIADTTTKKALALTSIEEAVDAILLHSESAAWLLNRKKITRTILFEYLHWKKVAVSGQAEKCTLIERVLQLWESTLQQDVVPQNNIHSIVQVPVAQVEKPEMGLQFARWFYGLLLAIHNQSPTAGNLADQFWADTSLKITFNSPEQIDQQSAIGAQETSALFHVLLCQHSLLLNPNLSCEGIREKKSPHGFTVIGVCGTVHREGNCSGIFEQVFGLLQDPAANFSWRIKWSELRITQAAVSRLPCVNDLPELQAICDSS